MDARKRKMQQGSLQQIKNRKGKLEWRAQWRENGRSRTRTLGPASTMGRAEALAMLRAIIGPLSANRDRARSSAVTLASYVKHEYLSTRSSSWKIGTERTTTALINLRILPKFGNRILSTITRRELQSHLDDLAVSLSKQVVSHTRFQLSAIFSMAVGDGAITVNPSQGLRLPRNAKRRQAPEIGDKEKISRAIMALEPRDRLFVQLCVWRGMRPGEVSALQLGDIRDGCIHVLRRIYLGALDDPKSDLGIREVAIGEMQDQLDFYIASLPDRRPEAWLFPSETGATSISAKNLYQRRLKPVFEAAGLRRFNYQAMRATFNTQLAELEPDAKVRADILGHTVDVNEQVYRRSTAEQRKNAIRLFDEDRLQ